MGLLEAPRRYRITPATSLAGPPGNARQRRWLRLARRGHAGHPDHLAGVRSRRQPRRQRQPRWRRGLLRPGVDISTTAQATCSSTEGAGRTRSWAAWTLTGSMVVRGTTACSAGKAPTCSGAAPRTTSSSVGQVPMSSKATPGTTGSSPTASTSARQASTSCAVERATTRSWPDRIPGQPIRGRTGRDTADYSARTVPVVLTTNFAASANPNDGRAARATTSPATSRP